MKYIIMLLISIPSLYTLSFAKYTWQKKNRMAAAGSAIAAIVSIILPCILLYTKF